MPIKPLPQSFDAKTGFAHTGSPLHLSDHHGNQEETDQWTQCTILEPELEADIIHEDKAPSVDVYVVSSDQILKETNKWKCPSPC